MPSTIILPVAQHLADISTALTFPSPIKAYVWAPGDLDALPAFVVEPPSGARTDPDEAESQLFTNDWDLDFTCTFYTDLEEAVAAQDRLVELVELYVRAIDSDEQLGGLCNSAKVTHFEKPAELQDTARSLLFTELNVAVQKFV